MEKSGEKSSLEKSPTEAKAVKMILDPEKEDEEATVDEDTVVVGGILKVAEPRNNRINGFTFEELPITYERNP